MLSGQSINTVLMKHHRNGYSPGGKREWKYFRADKPNDMWQIDIKGPFTIGGKRMYALVIIDDHSRFRLSCRLFTHIETKDVTEELLKCFHMYGSPTKVLVDHGPQFRICSKDGASRGGLRLSMPLFTIPRRRVRWSGI